MVPAGPRIAIFDSLTWRCWMRTLELSLDQCCFQGAVGWGSTLSTHWQLATLVLAPNGPSRFPSPQAAPEPQSPAPNMESSRHSLASLASSGLPPSPFLSVCHCSNFLQETLSLNHCTVVNILISMNQRPQPAPLPLLDPSHTSQLQSHLGRGRSSDETFGCLYSTHCRPVYPGLS